MSNMLCETPSITDTIHYFTILFDGNVLSNFVI